MATQLTATLIFVGLILTSAGILGAGEFGSASRIEVRVGSSSVPPVLSQDAQPTPKVV